MIKEADPPKDSRHSHSSIRTSIAMAPVVVACFGASVTQQGEGYVPRLREHLAAAAAPAGSHCPSVLQFGYGSMHLRSAGVCFIDEVIAARPSVCVLEWFTPDGEFSRAELDRCLGGVLRKLLRAGIAPLALWLRRRDEGTPHRLAVRARVMAALRDYGVALVDTQELPLDLATALRDVVHTQPPAAAAYAEALAAYLIACNYRPPMPSLEALPESDLAVPVGSVRGDWNAALGQTIQLQAHAACKVLGLYVQLGRHAGWVRVTHASTTAAAAAAAGESTAVTAASTAVAAASGAVTAAPRVSRFQMWDRWCHFGRKALRMAFDLPAGGCVTLEPTGEAVDTSACTVPGVAWETPRLQVLGVFYVPASASIDVRVT